MKILCFTIIRSKSFFFCEKTLVFQQNEVNNAKILFLHAIQ